ncbi:hypothetical protein Ddye_023965 [Dipteronia dyeriana]|uniref:Uncharacterized protein n=1 Tax=Dipteronia dyeriana TaxID=168575 RepID=A0AAD9TTY8_9ROSI|nr:hypothetical protein Ddye_023965 [Dipteronia dyeriana]
MNRLRVSLKTPEEEWYEGKEMRHNRPSDEMRFMLDTNEVRFSKVEFCLITGLRFRVVPDTSYYVNVDNITGTMVGAHIYSHSIYSFKHALDGLRERFQRRQQVKGADKHMQETYNIYGLSYTLLLFAFEVIPTLGPQFRTRMVTDLSPRILKLMLKIQPMGDKLLKIFTSRNLVPTTTKRDEPYFTEFVVDISDRDSGRRTSVVPSDTDDSEVEFGYGRPEMQVEGSKPELVAGRQPRQRRV